MKKFMIFILILIILGFSGAMYLTKLGGFDKWWPVQGYSVGQLRNAYYIAPLGGIPAPDKLLVRRAIPFGVKNEGLCRVRLMDGHALLTLLGSSELTVEGAFISPKEPRMTDGGDSTHSPGIKPFMPGMARSPSEEETDTTLKKKRLDRLAVSNFMGIAYVEMFTPMIINFDGSGVLGNGLRIRLAPYNASSINVTETLTSPVRLLFFKPERRRGFESVICLDLPPGLNLEIWLNDHRGYTLGKHNQFSFNRTPGLMETGMLPEVDRKKLAQWLQSEGVWSGGEKTALRPELLVAIGDIFNATLSIVKPFISSDLAHELLDQVEEWRLLRGVAIKSPSKAVPMPYMDNASEDNKTSESGSGDEQGVAPSASPEQGAAEYSKDTPLKPAPVQSLPELARDATR